MDGALAGGVLENFVLMELRKQSARKWCQGMNFRPKAQRAVWNLVHETLTHANLPASVSPLGGAMPPMLTGPMPLPNGAFQFSLTNHTSATFTVLSSTDLLFSLTDWTVIGMPTNNGSGVFLFTTEPLTNDARRKVTHRRRDHARCKSIGPGVASRQELCGRALILSHIHAGVFSRGAAERAEREAGHEFFNVGNHSPNGD